MKKNTGFTLIELLVVIAIIGILSSVVLASLNTARSKGSDAAIKSQMNSLRSQAILFYDTNQSYAGLLTDPQIMKIHAAIIGQGITSVASSASSTAFQFISPLKTASTSGATLYFCIDSVGNAIGTTTNTLNTVTGACQ